MFLDFRSFKIYIFKMMRKSFLKRSINLFREIDFPVFPVFKVNSKNQVCHFEDKVPAKEMGNCVHDVPLVHLVQIVKIVLIC